MQAIILAAGYGKRLRPITDRIPKCLVPVNGTPLLVRSLQLLDLRGVRKATIVVGHMKEKVYEVIGHRFGNIAISYVENDIYDKTNNVYSLWLARDKLCEDSLLLECDLYYDGSLLDALTEKPTDCDVLVSRYDPACMDGTVVTLGENDTITELIAKKNQVGERSYSDKFKTVNMYHFSRDFLRDYFVPYLDLFVRTYGTQSYYELVLGILMYLREPECRAVVVDSDRWYEIDNEDDLRRAEGRFCEAQAPKQPHRGE